MLGVVMAIGAIGACKGDKLKPEEAKAVTAKDQYAIDSARMEAGPGRRGDAERAGRLDVAAGAAARVTRQRDHAGEDRDLHGRVRSPTAR